MLSKIERGLFVDLFNRGGYVLDFSTPDFDAFTLASVGIALCEQYQLSKGKSLIAFVQNGDDFLVDRLLLDLLDYYEAKYMAECVDGVVCCSDSEKKYELKYMKCKEYAEREKSRMTSLTASVQYVSDHFTNEYLKQQVESLTNLCVDNPTDAIGKSKELIESCCKTILEGLGIAVEKNWDAPILVKKTMEALGIDANAVDPNGPEGKLVKQILGNLKGVAIGVIEFRNAYGSGHGKSDSFVALPVRHAKLAVGSSITFVEYLWETYEWRKSQQKC